MASSNVGRRRALVLRSSLPLTRGSRQRENEQRASEGGVLGQLLVAADRAEAFGRSREPRRHADAGPAADTGVRTHVLLAFVLVGEHVADDSGRRLELPQ